MTMTLDTYTHYGFLELLGWVAGIAGVVGLVSCAAAAALLLQGRRHHVYYTTGAPRLLSMALGCSLLGITFFVLSPTVHSLSWGAVLWTLGGLGASAAVGGALVLGRRLPSQWWQQARQGWSRIRARRQARAQTQRAAASLLAAVRARHDRVREAWGSYQLDLEAFLSAPALNDIVVPTTAAFVRSMARAQDLEAEAEAGPDRYAESVYDLESAWQQALAYAEKVGAAYLPAPDRFRRAAALLRLAHRDHNEGGHERAQALGKAQELLTGLVSPPERMVGELEVAVRQALA
ncbi:hypothetical protein ABZ234_08180 [Nocardiopsis sp. NPDC006198]|uniref:hypothetical protein n=1 Tax=Nocardiopsis sp. NPDC006198 TaxID=3154472 RepID=UPI0033ABCB4B